MTDVIVVPAPAEFDELVVGVPVTPSVSVSASAAIDEVVSINGSITTVEVLLTPSIDTVEVIQQGPAGRPGKDGTELVSLTFTAPTLQVLRIADGSGYRITSIDSDPPNCDGVLLESGNMGDFRLVGTAQGFFFDTPLIPPGVSSDILYLSQSGNLTNIEPSIIAGDVWELPVARRASNNQFIYEPGFPVKLA